MANAGKHDREKRPVRIFHIVTHFDMGGAEKVAANIAASQTPGTEYHMVEVMRASTPFTREFMDGLSRSGIRIHRAHMPDIRFHFLFERIAALCFPLWFLPVYLRWRPDVIHVHTETPDMSLRAFFLLFPRLRRCRIVRTVHNTRLWTGQDKLGRHMERFYQRAAHNVAISPSVQSCYAKAYGLSLPIIYNGVQPVDQKSYAGIKKGCINVLFAGRFEQQKGIVHLVRLLHSMAGDRRYHFHIMGDGSLRPDVERAVAQCDNATLTPPMFGLSSVLGSFDCLFMPSEFEGLSIMSIEASMAGLPVVANDCPGLGDTLPPSWPLKVNGNDDEAFLHLFSEVIPHSDLRSLGAEAKAYALSRFGIRLMQTEYEKIYLD